MELVSDDYFRQVAMEVLLATELDDKSAARGSLDLTYLDDIPEERALGSGKSSEEKEITRLDSGLLCLIHQIVDLLCQDYYLSLDLFLLFLGN